MRKLNFKALLPSTVAAALGVASTASHAALDAAVTTAITNITADLTSLFGALTAAGAAIFVLRVIYRHFKVR